MQQVDHVMQERSPRSSMHASEGQEEIPTSFVSNTCVNANTPEESLQFVFREMELGGIGINFNTQDCHA